MKKNNIFQTLFKFSLILLFAWVLEVTFFGLQADVKIFIGLVAIVCINIYCTNYFYVVEDGDYSHTSKMILFYSIIYLSILLLAVSILRGQKIVIEASRQANFTPIVNTVRDIKQIISYKNFWLLSSILCNIVMFVPFSYLIPRVRKNTCFKKTVILIFILSLMIECFQYAFGTGIFDIDDIILNVIGSIIFFPLLNNSSLSKTVDKFIFLNSIEFSTKDYLEISVIIVLGLFFLTVLISSYWNFGY